MASEEISIYLGKDGAKESVITVLTFASPIRIKSVKICHYIQKMTLQQAVLENTMEFMFVLTYSPFYSTHIRYF